MNKILSHIKQINISHIQEWLLYLFIFILPWQARWIFKDSVVQGEVFEYGRMSLYGFDILIFIMGAIWIVGRINILILKNRNKIFSTQGIRNFTSTFFKQQPRATNILLGCLCLLGLLSIIWSPGKTIAFYWSIRILEGVIFFCLIQKINFFKTRLAIVFVIAAVVQSALGILQFFIQSTFASKWLGLAAHYASDLGPSVIELSNERWLRSYGAFPHPNILGGFLLLGFIFLVYLFYRHESIKALKHENKNTIKLNFFIPVFLYGALVFITAGIFFSFSRAAWLGLFIILLISIIYYINVLIMKRRAGEKNSKANLFIVSSFSFMRLRVASLVIVLWLILSIIYLPLVKTRLGIGETQRLEIKSNTERIFMTQQSLEITKTNPILGVGLGNYTYYLVNQYPNQPAWWYQPVHNTYLLVWAELGVVGFLLLLVLNLYILKFLIHLISNSSNKISNIQYPVYLLCFLFVIYCLLFFDHYFWTNTSMFLTVWLVWGLSYKVSNISLI